MTSGSTIAYATVITKSQRRHSAKLNPTWRLFQHRPSIWHVRLRYARATRKRASNLIDRISASRKGTSIGHDLDASTFTPDGTMGLSVDVCRHDMKERTRFLQKLFIQVCRSTEKFVLVTKLFAQLICAKFAGSMHKDVSSFPYLMNARRL
jgi:hypothetical protein